MNTEEQHKTIQRVIAYLQQNGIFDRLSQNCIAATEIISSMRLHEGIVSKTVECCLTVRNNTTTPASYTLIGYDGIAQQSQIDVHLVLVTETETPLLIDASIQYALPEDTHYIIAPISKDNTEVLAEFSKDGFELRYTEKRSPKIPALHQKSILQKIKNDEIVKEKLKLLQTGVFVIGGFALVNFTLNMIAIVLKIIYP